MKLCADENKFTTSARKIVFSTSKYEFSAAWNATENMQPWSDDRGELAYELVLSRVRNDMKLQLGGSLEKYMKVVQDLQTKMRVEKVDVWSDVK